MKRKNIISSILLGCCLLFSAAVFSACDMGVQGPQGLQGEQGIQGEQGPQGEQGVGIDSIEKISTNGNVDTYKITLTDGTATTFTIANGVDGANGQDGINGVNGTDGVSVTAAEINANGELILSFSVGNPINLGKVVGEKGANGENGEDGVGISAIELSKEGDLTVILTNETTVALGNIKGKDGANGMSGADGVSITGAQLNTNGELIISFSKGESVNLGKIVGADGKNGENGTNGVSVEHISLENYQLTMKLSDGTVFELGNIRGEKGDKGDKGETGVTGANGKSAYQLYQEKYGYAGTEEEWLDDLVNGRLATVITYTVTFNPNNGEETFTETAQKDTKLSRPENPTAPAGYTFAGWYGGDYLDEQWSFIGYTVTEEMTLVAKYEPIVYAVEYHLNKGLNDVSNPAEFTVETLPISLNEPFKQDCEFLGWYADAEFTVPIEELTELGSLSLYAKWKEGTAGLRYSMQSGSYCVSGYSGAETEVYIPTTHYGIPVTAIAASAFQNCADLVSVEVPNSVESIGSSAFKGCSSLTNMVLPFVGGSKTTDQREKQFFGYIFGCITGSYYSNASEVTSGTIRQYVTSSVSNSGLTTYTYYDYYIPTSIHSIVITGGDILEGVFNGCSMLQNVIIPDYVTSIGASVFKGCTGLTEVVIPNSVTSIGDYAFSGCAGLTEVVIPNSVTSIGNYAFSGCAGLTKVIIPDSVTSIGAYAFSGCTNLFIYCETKTQPSAWNMNWNYSNRPVVWDCNNNDVASDGCVYTVVDDTHYSIKDGNATLTKWTKDVTTVNIPASITYKETSYPVTVIATSVFYGCTGLTEVVIPDSVTSIGSSAFSGCTGLTSVIIPNSVTSIGNSAFSGCTGLTSVTIGKSVSKIGQYAFNNCSSLRSVIFEDTSTWYSTSYSSYSGGTKISVTTPSNNATYLKSHYPHCYWYQI